MIIFLQVGDDTYVRFDEICAWSPAVASESDGETHIVLKNGVTVTAPATAAQIAADVKNVLDQMAAVS